MSVWVAENLGHAFVKICCAVCGRVAHFHPQQTFLKATMQSSANLETQVNSTNSTASPSDETKWKPIWKDVFSSVQLLSHVRLFVTLWTAACQASLSITNSRGPPKTMSIESVIPSNHLILCHPLLLLPSIFPIIRVFQMSQLFASGGQSIRVSASPSFLPMNTQDWSPLGWTGWISLQPKGLSRVFSNTTVQKRQFFSAQLSSHSNSHIHTWPLGKS